MIREYEKNDERFVLGMNFMQELMFSVQACLATGVYISGTYEMTEDSKQVVFNVKGEEPFSKDLCDELEMHSISIDLVKFSVFFDHNRRERTFYSFVWNSVLKSIYVADAVVDYEVMLKRIGR